MEVTRYWRFQEARYMGQGSNLFESSKPGTNPEGKRRLKNRLTEREFEYSTASEFVAQLRRQKFNDRTIWDLAGQLSFSDEGLEGFLAGVNAILSQEQQGMVLPLQRQMAEVSL